jgi:large subunit ribosomal protein L4
LANQRQGTHKTKGRSEVAGSTRKLHKQKGTGGSRKGDIKNPLYHGGGRIFGPVPRDYEQKLNKKVRKLARVSALSAKAAAGSIVVVEDFTFENPKTKAFLDILQNLKLSDKKSILVTPEHDKVVYLSGRNLPTAKVIRAQDLNVYDIMNAKSLVLSEAALGKLTESLA